MDYIITKINSTQKKFTCVIESFKEFACDCGDMCAILNCFDIEERCFLLDAMKGRIVDPEHKARILRCFPNEWQEEAIRILDMVKKPCRFKYPTQKAPQVVLHPHSSQHKPTQRPVVIHKQQNYAPKKKETNFFAILMEVFAGCVQVADAAAKTANTIERDAQIIQNDYQSIRKL
ncbi:MAG: hypothetical protein ACQUHE_13865 [Bacteroidia bacterium]